MDLVFFCYRDVNQQQQNRKTKLNVQNDFEFVNNFKILKFLNLFFFSLTFGIFEQKNKNQGENAIKISNAAS